MAHPGLELVKYLKANGGSMVSKSGHHEVWELDGERFRIATAGKRPIGVFKDMKRKAQSRVKMRTPKKKKKA